MIKVRLARPADKQEIFRLFFLAHQENGLFPANVEKVEWWLNRILWPESIPPFDTGTRGLIGVIGDGQLEGMAFIMIGGFWYTDQKHLEEYIVFVDPAFRAGKDRVKALVEWMKRQSKLANLPLITGVMSNKRTQEKVRLYRTFLLDPIGAFFCYDPSANKQMMLH